jgi:hypothetical protein
MSSRRTGYAIVISLIVASALAFARAEQVKLEHSPVTAVRITHHFSPICRPGPRRCKPVAPLSFKLRKPSVVELTLIDSSGHTVWTFTPPGGRHYPAGRVKVHWNGRLHSGAKAPDGHYRLRVALPTLHRTITIPNNLIVDTVPPRLTLVSRPGAIPVRYTVSEPSHVYLAIRPDNGGRTGVLRGHNGRFRIPPPLHHLPATMVMVAIDLAGNSSGQVPAGRLK